MRVCELFETRGICPTLAANGRGCENYPRGAEQDKTAAEQLPIHKQDDQAAMIERSLAAIERFTRSRK